jgi:hypothetical protein
MKKIRNQYGPICFAFNILDRFVGQTTANNVFFMEIKEIKKKNIYGRQTLYTIYINSFFLRLGTGG